MWLFLKTVNTVNNTLRKEETTMSLQKISAWIAIALAIIAAFTTIPYVGAVLVILGAIAGYGIAGEDHVRVIVSALALTALSGTLTPIPAVGSYLTSIVGSVGLMAAGAALCLILCNIYRRFKP
jgi:hypothetical protein